MDTNSDGNSYKIEPTVFNSDIYSDTDSTAKSENAYKAST
jgi:hypothetical protein